MGQLADKLMAHLSQKLPRAFEAIGVEVREDIKDSLAMSYPPASSPGSPPARRTGNLQDGVMFSVHNNGVTIGSERVEGDPQVPTFLEFGTSKMPARPYMGPARSKAPLIVRNKLKEMFQ